MPGLFPFFPLFLLFILLFIFLQSCFGSAIWVTGNCVIACRGVRDTFFDLV